MSSKNKKKYTHEEETQAFMLWASDRLNEILTILKANALNTEIKNMREITPADPLEELPMIPYISVEQVLTSARIMNKNQVEKNRSLLNVAEEQRKIIGNTLFLNVVSNVNAQVQRGGVKNPIGYFRNSLNNAVKDYNGN